MTFNVAGGKAGPVRGAEPGGDLAAIIEVVREQAPDILILQEATDWQLADGSWGSVTREIAAACGFGDGYHFAPTLTLSRHLNVSKALMVEAVFADLLEWRQGNAILSRTRFVRLADPSRPGSPRSVPVFRAPQYEGDRNTEPRDAVVARVDCGPISPFVVGVHLTTLTGERGSHPDPRRVLEAQQLRRRQAERLLRLLRPRVLSGQEVVFLVGDFNAERDEPCIAQVLEGQGGFKLLEGPGATHQRLPRAIDHVLVHPPARVIEYRCRSVVGSGSDHHPVVADVLLDVCPAGVGG
ncbi:MAG TPA: endonuclease/exonuclease/phosphatase family protein [Candidatus Dormibacteraeota bacterium]|nr:endonuclease/exonuclease/phosphatase family protein [Candidatus Dormibacteraeota bacterium]